MPGPGFWKTKILLMTYRSCRKNTTYSTQPQLLPQTRLQAQLQTQLQHWSQPDCQFANLNPNSYPEVPNPNLDFQVEFQ